MQDRVWFIPSFLQNLDGSDIKLMILKSDPKLNEDPELLASAEADQRTNFVYDSDMWSRFAKRNIKGD